MWKGAWSAHDSQQAGIVYNSGDTFISPCNSSLPLWGSKVVCFCFVFFLLRVFASHSRDAIKILINLCSLSKS